MGFAELFLLAVGLSIDAFAIAICKGFCMRRLRLDQAAVIGLFFGGFQALMPVIGWVLGKQFEAYIVSIDHWIAFFLLAFIGGKMIWEALHSQEDEADACSMDQKLDLKELVMMAIATSIDALAVGISFAVLGVDILPAALLIGIVTFTLSAVGIRVGHHFGLKYKARAEIAGGVILILIGLKILLEHLGIISF